MSARTAVFDEWEFDGDENPVGPGGKEVVKWLADGIGEHSPVVRHQSYGWSFNVVDRGPPVWCLVAMGPGEGEHYFWAETRPSIWKKLIGQKARPDQATLERMAEILANDERFDAVRIVPPGN